MKVAELSPGMLLTPDNDRACFVSYEANWQTDQTGIKLLYVYGTSPKRPGFKSRVMMYLGTRKDLNIDILASDKFAFIDNQIVAVDPSSWRRIKPV